MKTCSKCDDLKPETEFNFKNKAAGRRETICRACKKTIKDRHYQANKQDYITKAKAGKNLQRKRNKRFTDRVKALAGCRDCGNRNPVVLDFDHLEDKAIGISRAVAIPWSITRLKTEIRKCVVRCANCHRIKTHERARSSKAERQAFNPVSV